MEFWLLWSSVSLVSRVGPRCLTCAMEGEVAMEQQLLLSPAAVGVPPPASTVHSHVLGRTHTLQFAQLLAQNAKELH
eukprot:6468210-Amphidinium_carterae.1